MTLKFYKYAGTRNTVNKRAELALLTPLTVSSDRVAGDQDLENIVLHVTASENTLSGYNYVYIQDWERYYFIIKMTWLADGIYNITCEEDYLNTWCVKAGANTSYGGIAKYSGLGDSNLQDPRITFKPESKIEAFELFYANTNAVPLQDWYCLKFMSTDPFRFVLPMTVPTHYVINVAIMNEESYKKFIESYNAKTEDMRVALARMILSVNRIKYIAPDPVALADYKVSSINFTSPFDYQGAAYINVETGSTSEYETYIISHPDAVQYLFNRRVTVVNNGTTTAHVFNQNDRFWELDAQYYIKLPELQPIPFKPGVFGKKSSFTIYFDIGYEPYSENYVIKFYPDSATGGNQSPIVQKCAISIPFMADTSLDFYELRSMSSVASTFGKVTGSIEGMVFGLISGNGGGIGGALAAIAGGPINEIMAQRQLAIQDYMNFGTTGGLGGSPDWIYGGITDPADGRMYVITQQPVDTFFDNLGKPDGHRRSILALAGSGYAELQIINPPALDGATYNELLNFNALCAQGVLF